MELKSQTNILALVEKNLKHVPPESLQELSGIDEELDKRNKKEAAKYYIPNGKVAEFIKLVGSGKSFINFFIAGNGVGKTAAGCNIVANICFGVQNEWFNYPLFQKFPYLKRGRIISDPTTIKEKIIPELKLWLPGSDFEELPDAEYQTAKEGKSYEAKFYTKTGWQIDIMSNEQDPKEFEAVDLGFVWFDEPTSEAIFKATVARGRRGMIMWWTMTPLFHSAWIKDELIDKASEKGVDWVEGEIEDNCKIHGIRGILRHKDIEKMVATYSEDELEARAFGHFGHLLGRVHKLFNKKIHVIKPFLIDEKKYAIYHALDPHPRTPDHAIWVAVNKYGTKYVCAELVTRGLPRELVIRIRDIETTRKLRVERRLIDPSAYIDDQHNEKASVGSQLFSLGLHYIKGSKDLQAGIKRTDDALNYEMKGGLFVQEPEIYFFDNCPVAIKQMEEYVWDEYRGSSADDKQPKGRPKDRNDHQVENIHRILLSEPEFVPFASQQGYSQPYVEENYDPY